MYFLNAHIVVLLSVIVQLLYADRHQCNLDDDVKTVFTPCDSDGARWKVRVPSTLRSCSIEGVDGSDCSFQCKAGQYRIFDGSVNGEKCQNCEKGSFSLGNGLRFENFEKIPDGFSVATHPRTVSKEVLHSAIVDDCSLSSGWFAGKGFLKYSPNFCYSDLIYPVHLRRSGYVIFQYYLQENIVSLTLQVKNGQCQTGKRNSSFELRPSYDGRFQMRKVHLKAGTSVLVWSAETLALSAVSGVGALIRFIEINGSDVIDQCTFCPPGTFANQEGSARCTPCAINTFSSSNGAEQCETCPADQFSPERSSRCYDRKMCEGIDFYESYGECDTSRGMEVSYQYLLPQKCTPGLFTLPGQYRKSCGRACNPGFDRDPSGQCKPCDVRYASDGIQNCYQCPADTEPNYGISMMKWTEMPTILRGECLVESNDDVAKDKSCKNPKNAWLFAGDHIINAPTMEEGVLYYTLHLVIDGFKTPDYQGLNGDMWPVSWISFRFSMKCSAPNCVLYFLEKSGIAREYRALSSWNGTVDQIFRSPIFRTTKTEFMWAFMRGDSGIMSSPLSYDHVADRIKIFEINVTNTKQIPKWGALSCEPCPEGIDAGSDRCKPCPIGSYIDLTDKSCRSCPEKTFLNQTAVKNTGDSACAKCGPGLISNLYKDRCVTDCVNITLGDRTYDFSALNGSYEAQGVRIWGQESMMYHLYTINLCKMQPKICLSNMSIFDGNPAKYTSKYFLDNYFERGYVCKSSILPKSGGVHSSFSIAGDIIAITHDKSFAGLHVVDYFDSKNVLIPDVYFYYVDGERSTQCPLGHSTILTLRCDPSKETANDTKISLPKSCPDGTCDGCNYHLMIQSRFACPICGENDFKVIKGECGFGSQQVHYIPKDYCVMSKEAQTEETVTCSVLNLTTKMLIGIAISTAPVLLGIVICVWKKNRKLEYKYMKLVANKKGGKKSQVGQSDGYQSDDEDVLFPKAESCGIDDGDDEMSDTEDQNTRLESRSQAGEMPKKQADPEVVFESGGGVGKKGGFFGSKSMKYRLFDPISQSDDKTALMMGEDD